MRRGGRRLAGVDLLPSARRAGRGGPDDDGATRRATTGWRGRWHGTVLAPRPGAWDARGARRRPRCSPTGRAYYDGRATKEENFRAAAPGVRRRHGDGARSRDVRYLDVARRSPAARSASTTRRGCPTAATSCARALRLAGMSEPRLITATGAVPASLARVQEPSRPPFRVGLVQQALARGRRRARGGARRGIAMAAGEGARLVCLQELTLSPYFAVTPDAIEQAAAMAEAIPDGPTTRSPPAARAEHGIHVHASLYERADDGGLGYNTAIVVAPDGVVVAHAQAAHPGHRRLLRGQVLPARRRRQGYPGRRARGGAASASRRAGTSGSRSWPARTRSAAPR